MVRKMSGNAVDKLKWAKAKKAFSDSYNRIPESPPDFKITMSIYKDMGGRLNSPMSKSVAEKLFGKVSKIGG